MQPRRQFGDELDADGGRHPVEVAVGAVFHQIGFRNGVGPDLAGREALVPSTGEARP